MASDVDATIPADNVKVEKAQLRANFATIKTEIETLQRQTSLPWRIATGQTAI